MLKSMVFGIDHHFLYYLNILIRAALIGFQLDTLQYLRCTPKTLRTTAVLL